MNIKKYSAESAGNLDDFGHLHSDRADEESELEMLEDDIPIENLLPSAPMSQTPTNYFL